MNYKILKIKKGFTLVEILIVIAIVVIMSGVLLSQNNTQKKAQAEVEGAARIVASTLRTLQSDAVNGKQIGGVNVCRARMLQLTAPATSFNIDYCSECAGPTCGVGLGTINFDKYNVTLSQLAPSNIAFNVPRGERNQAADVSILVTSNRDPNINETVCACHFGSIAERKNTGNTPVDCTAECQ